MGYVLTGGAGLILGLGLMIWALKERAMRYRAEKRAMDYVVDRDKYARLAKWNAAKQESAESKLRKMRTEASLIRNRLHQTRIRLAKCSDPKTVKAWLDEELQKEIL